MRNREKTRASPEAGREAPRLPLRRNAKPAEMHENRILGLQQPAGNQAMLDLLTSGAIQAKLRVSQPGDADEVEADRAADQVVSSPEPPAIHRQAASSSDSGQAVPNGFLQSIGPGQPLDPATRSLMESRFGRDFGKVTVHTGEAAASSAEQIQARAYTADQRIVFGQGQYTPGSKAGTRLLAHELAHVSQNQNARSHGLPAAKIHRDSLVGSASNWVEEKKENAGKWIEDKKWAVYRAMIAGLKAEKNRNIAMARALVTKLPAAIQGAASSIVDVGDFIVDLEIGLLLAIVGLAVGFVEGLVGLVTGLVKLAMGFLKMMFDWLLSLLGRPEEYQKDVNDLVAAIKGIPPGLKQLFDQWLARYKRAPLEEQVLMGGELVGQVEAFIATFALAGTKAGQATTLTVNVGETTAKVAAGTGLTVLEPAEAVTVTIPAVVPKTAAEAAIVSSQMTAMGATGGGGAGIAGRAPEQKKDTPKKEEDEGTGEREQASKSGEAEQSRLQKKYGARSKTNYPDIEWRRIEQLEERFPKLKSAKLRPVRRPGTGSEAIFEERMQTTQGNYSLAGYGADGQQVIQFDGISPNGFIEEIKIEQSAQGVDDIVAQLRAQADFARDYGLRGVEYSVQSPAVADAVEARVAEEHLRNVYRLP